MKTFKIVKWPWQIPFQIIHRTKDWPIALVPSGLFGLVKKPKQHWHYIHMIKRLLFPNISTTRYWPLITSVWEVELDEAVTKQPSGGEGPAIMNTLIHCKNSELLGYFLSRPCLFKKLLSGSFMFSWCSLFPLALTLFLPPPPQDSLSLEKMNLVETSLLVLRAPPSIMSDICYLFPSAAGKSLSDDGWDTGL